VQIAVKCPEDEGLLDVLQSLGSEGEMSTALSPASLPMGLIGFRMSVPRIGSTVAVTIYFSEALPDGAYWYKYTRLNGWEEYGNHVDFSADMRSVTVYLQDGGFGDVDGIANGIIVDPSGPAVILSDNSGSNTGASGAGGGCFIDASRSRCARHNPLVDWGMRLLNVFKRRVE
jgi:hypothetical protein